ncbi:toll/interleukin-1 receptor domain-containing protein [Vibrio crassostreae]|uniref:TIR domain-containing protein n=1 Tax=Vibrio crassostreae TaxID=246167 RepID=A0ABM9QZP3_9VIBR|nr:toll/interleukin-1 receptor domain-containing protein [Vibrio crassostreae]TCL28287.1 TIR domain-containing protein [Vibrio crassostreae]TCT50539.1 TIR domain-containing protein [Vibrio crassostreae]TCT59615.1 TIR domain-containing protein [Vibrio crassostreae]CAK2010898.1 TIR domain-containing protein [Vibrio crassostreae]CAK2057578.1 TIR domain-containing protein [Vibrio crassostreae]
MKKSVFISHAVKNKELADQLVDLLETGVGVSDSEIFCSSLEGLGIPSGVNFVDFIKEKILEPKVVILLISQDYIQSQFCLAELGASWALSHNVVPILIPPLEFKDIKAVLTGVQLVRINDKDGLNQMQADLLEHLSISGKPFARWESKRNRFLDNISDFLVESDSDFISKSQWNDLQKKYDDALGEIESMEGELDSKDELIDMLKNSKDATEVESIIVSNLSEIEKFEDLANEASVALATLPEIVREAIYKHFRGEELPYPDFGEDYKRQLISDAVENDFLSDTGSGFAIEEEDPVVADALSNILKLDKFIDDVEVESEEFCEYYENKYDHRLKFLSKRFWGEHLL